MKSTQRLPLEFALLVLVGACTHASAANITWTNAASGNWSVAANWNPNQVPGAGDIAIITKDAVTVTLDVSPTVGGITLGANANCGVGTMLVVNGQTLTLNGPLVVGSCGHFTVDAGKLVGGANATLSGVIGWGGGFQAIFDGTLTLAAGGTLNITAETYHDMPNAGTLINNGTVVWTGGPVRGGPGRIIQNNGVWIAQVTNEINSDWGVPSAFNNSGTFDVQSGAVTIRSAGTNSGTFHASANATCTFKSAYIFNSGTKFTGAGANRFTDSICTLNGAITSENLEFTAGTITAAANATVSGVMSWGGGFQAKLDGTLTLAANGTLNIIAATFHDMPDGGGVINNGTVRWTGGPVRGGVGTVIQNNGLWIAQVTDEINNDWGNTSIFNNSGTFDVQSGAVTIRSLGASSGTFRVAAGATCEFAASRNFDDGTALIGAGINRLSGVNGVYTLTGTIDAQNVEFTAGQLAGDHILSGSGGVPGSFTWIAGNAANMNTPGATTIASDATLTIVGAGHHDFEFRTLKNNGTVVCTGGDVRSGLGGGVQNSGLWLVQADIVISDDWGKPMEFHNTGILRKTAGAGVASVQCNFTNDGTASAEAGTLQFAKNFANPSGTIAAAAGSTVQFTLPVVVSGGLVTGSGTIQAPTITSGATVRPGSVDAVLTLSGDYVQSYNGSMEFEIDGTSPGVNQSQVKVTGTAKLDGLVGLHFSNGFSPAVGSHNVVLTANSVTGAFHCFDHFMLLGENKRLMVAYHPADVTLTAAAAPDPAGPSLGYSLHDQMLVCWPSEFTGFELHFKNELEEPTWTPLPGLTYHYLDPKTAPHRFFVLIKP